MSVGFLGWEDSLEKEMAAHSSYSCLENSMGRGAWWATVYEGTKCRTQLNMHTCAGWSGLDPQLARHQDNTETRETVFALKKFNIQAGV